ncbi:MAG: hypothetical protein CMP48_11720 [Rickettsiales bacterium]|nr:hypothetical protein [Rickettsiales bacterium]
MKQLYRVLFLISSLSFQQCGLLDEPLEDEENLTIEVTGVYRSLMVGKGTLLGTKDINVIESSSNSVLFQLPPSLGYPNFHGDLAKTSTGNIGFTIPFQTQNGISIEGLANSGDFNGVFTLDTDSLVFQAVFEESGVADTVTVIGQRIGDVNDNGGAGGEASLVIFDSSWGSYGNDDDEIDMDSNGGIIKVTESHVFIAGRAGVKKFTTSGDYVAHIEATYPKFYIYEDYVYMATSDYNSGIVKMDMNLVPVDSIDFGEDLDLYSCSSIDGNDTQALIAYSRVDDGPVEMLHFNEGDTSITQISDIGEDPLEFKWNGTVAIDLFEGNYYVTDNGNNRVQIISTSGSFVDDFYTDAEERTVYNGPNLIEVTESYIFVGNLNNAGDEIDVYDRSSLELVTSLEIGNQLFKSGFAFNSTRLFVLSNYPDVEVLVFTIN